MSRRKKRREEYPAMPDMDYPMAPIMDPCHRPGMGPMMGHRMYCYCVPCPMQGFDHGMNPYGGFMDYPMMPDMGYGYGMNVDPYMDGWDTYYQEYPMMNMDDEEDC